jgi:hypothetical protein
MIMKKRFYSLPLILLLLTAGFSFGQINLTDPLPIAPEIKLGTLSNGLTF